jgi:arylformamidase
VLTTIEMARLYGRLAAGPDGSRPALVRDAMMARPEWIGGPGRIDTRLMQANPGRVIAKEGAEGLLAIGIVDGGIGVLVKTSAGYLPSMAALAAAPLLARFGVVGVASVPAGQTVRYHTGGLTEISPLVSEELAVWPGDVSFRRTVSLDTQAGAHLTLSSIETTVHVGAHVDAINHFSDVAEGVDAADPSRYVGPCQVVEVRKPRGELIAASDLAGVSIRARRVLFKTGSYPDPRRFNEDFVAFSAEAIDELAARGVVLVGIDTPSVDHCQSKELAAHHATARAGMAILEGIVLSDVAPGFYELIAAPLRLAGADASPVRALLRPL